MKIPIIPSMQIPERPTNTFCLCRTGEKEHLEAVQKGHLRFRPFSVYKTKADSDKVWHDQNEGLSISYPPEMMKVVIDIGHGKELVLDRSNGLQEIVASSDRKRTAVFCLHAISLPGQNLGTSPPNFDLLRKQAQIPAKMRAFGSYVLLFLNFNKLLDRVESAIKGTQLLFEAGPTQYVNTASQHGIVPRDMIGFIKHISYSHEREFRFKLTSATNMPDPFIFDVGDLSDISRIFDFSDLNQRIRIDSI